MNDLTDANKLSVDQKILISGTRVGEWSWPVPGREILSYFGVKRGAHRHRGIDIRGKKGQQVRAVRAGRVLSSSRMQGYGKTVVVDHGDGLRSLYAHNSTILVEPGEPVRRGQPIARVGRTGNASTHHCHLDPEGQRPHQPSSLPESQLTQNLWIDTVAGFATFQNGEHVIGHGATYTVHRQVTHPQRMWAEETPRILEQPM